MLQRKVMYKMMCRFGNPGLESTSGAQLATDWSIQTPTVTVAASSLDLEGLRHKESIASMAVSSFRSKSSGNLGTVTFLTTVSVTGDTRGMCRLGGGGTRIVCVMVGLRHNPRLNADPFMNSWCNERLPWNERLVMGGLEMGGLRGCCWS
jgi:hypothetical protein